VTRNSAASANLSVRIVDKKVDNLHGDGPVLATLETMTRKFCCAALWAGMLFLVGVGAHAQTPLAPALIKVASIKVGYSNVSGFSGLFVAKSEGMFARRGLDVEPILIALNSTMPAALVGDSVQIAGPTPPVFLQAVEGGLDIAVIAGCSANDTSQSGQGVVARTGTVIKTAKDFEGKRVGVPGLGTYMHVMFRRWLVDRGADDRKVRFIEVPFAQGGDILKAGNVDAMVTTDPYYSRIVQAKTGYLVASFLQQMPDGLFSIYYAANRDWAVKNPAAIKAFRAAIDEANAFVLKEPVKTRDILGKALKLPPDALATIVIPKLNVTVPQSDLKFWIDTLVAQGITRTRPDPTKLIIN
jgi:NitT/TauT family transport system substrate-binding protein